jgi:transposase
LLPEYISKIDFLTAEIKNIESKIRIEASNNKSVNVLMSMTGIDYLSAMMLSFEIGDITRFSSPQKLGKSGFREEYSLTECFNNILLERRNICPPIQGIKRTSG